MLYQAKIYSEGNRAGVVSDHYLEFRLAIIHANQAPQPPPAPVPTPNNWVVYWLPSSTPDKNMFLTIDDASSNIGDLAYKRGLAVGRVQALQRFL